MELARTNPYSYTLKPRLGTALQLLEATDYVMRRMREFAHPFLVLQGMADVVTDPALAKAFHDQAASEEKEIKLYEDFWHSLTAGELEPNVDQVFQDIFDWYVGWPCSVGVHCTVLLHPVPSSSRARTPIMSQGRPAAGQAAADAHGADAVVAACRCWWRCGGGDDATEQEPPAAVPALIGGIDQDSSVK